MHVIINGTSSETLQGLQVLSLPPIKKPRMRTSIAQIDGRPGDIVTRLGYEAYDRAITVLLHHTYDTEAISAFFNSSGKIVFSNEPDRVYDFETIEEINFEKAARWKTATVTFHVQPYKLAYPAESVIVQGASAALNNQGNTDSAPRLMIDGSGDVAVRLDGSQIFEISMPTGGRITIDAATMDAYASGVLANRSVIGSYDNFRLSPGSHSLECTGSVNGLVIENVSRWV